MNISAISPLFSFIFFYFCAVSGERLYRHDTVLVSSRGSTGRLPVDRVEIDEQTVYTLNPLGTTPGAEVLPHFYYFFLQEMRTVDDALAGYIQFQVRTHYMFGLVLHPGGNHNSNTWTPKTGSRGPTGTRS